MPTIDEKRIELKRRLLRQRLAANRAPQEVSREGAAAQANELLLTQNPVAQMGEAALLSAGRTFTRMGQGAQRLIPGGESPESIEARAQAETEAFSPIRRTFPVASMLGGAAPLAPGAAASVPGAAAFGAAAGALEPEGNPAINAAVGGVLGGAAQGVANTVGRLAGGRIPGDLSRRAKIPVAGKNLQQRAEGLGIRLTPAQQSQRQGARIAESQTRRNAITASFFEDQAEHNQVQINRAVLKQVGLEGDAVDLAAIIDRKAEVGDLFDEVAESIREWKPTRRALDHVTRASKMIQNSSSSEVKRVFAQAQQIMRNPKGVEEAVLKQTMMDVRQLAAQAHAGPNKIDAEILDELHDGLLTGLEESMTASMRKTLRKAKRQWRDLSILERSGVVKGTDVQPGMLYSAVTRSKFTQRAYRQGAEQNNGIFEVARLYEQLGSDSSLVGKVRSSGTPEGQSISLGGLVESIPLSFLALAQTRSPRTQAIIGQGAARGGSLASRILALEGLRSMNESK